MKSRLPASIRKLNPRMLVLIGILVVGTAISIYRWSAQESDGDRDPTLMAMKQTYGCGKCGRTFEKTVGEATEEYRAGGGHIKCPFCGALDPVEQTPPASAQPQENAPATEDSQAKFDDEETVAQDTGEEAAIPDLFEGETSQEPKPAPNKAKEAVKLGPEQGDSLKINPAGVKEQPENENRNEGSAENN